jgi:hypothetical protein
MVHKIAPAANAPVNANNHARPCFVVIIFVRRGASRRHAPAHHTTFSPRWAAPPPRRDVTARAGAAPVTPPAIAAISPRRARGTSVAECLAGERNPTRTTTRRRDMQAKLTKPAKRTKLTGLTMIGSTLALALGSGCGLMAVKDQQDAMMTQMAQRQAENEVKQREQLKKSFEQSYDAQESSYELMRSKLEGYESKYQDWLGGVTPGQKTSHQFASVTKVHDELKAKVDKMEADHNALVQWYEQTKDKPTNDDAMKLTQTYGSFSQKSQLYFSSYVDVNGQTMAVSARK